MWVCGCMCMVTSRIIGYVDAETIDMIENSTYTKSGFVREAIREKAQREGLADE